MPEDEFSKLQNLFHEVSLSRLQWLTGESQLRQMESPADNLNILERWLCLIQLSHQDFRLIFKCHFGEPLCAHLLKKPLTQENIDSCFDQVRELSNLVIGGVKAGLGDMRLGVSLPLILGGFDEMFLRPPADKMRLHHIWGYRSEKFSIYFSVEAMIFDSDVMSKLNTAIENNSSSQGGETELF